MGNWIGPCLDRTVKITTSASSTGIGTGSESDVCNGLSVAAASSTTDEAADAGDGPDAGKER
jgi:hypothetical protein